MGGTVILPRWGFGRIEKDASEKVADRLVSVSVVYQEVGE